MASAYEQPRPRSGGQKRSRGGADEFMGTENVAPSSARRHEHRGSEYPVPSRAKRDHFSGNVKRDYFSGSTQQDHFSGSTPQNEHPRSPKRDDFPGTKSYALSSAQRNGYLGAESLAPGSAMRDEVLSTGYRSAPSSAKKQPPPRPPAPKQGGAQPTNRKQKSTPAAHNKSMAVPSDEKQVSESIVGFDLLAEFGSVRSLWERTVSAVRTESARQQDLMIQDHTVGSQRCAMP